MIDWTAAGSILQLLRWPAMIVFWTGLILLVALIFWRLVPRSSPVAVPVEVERLPERTRPGGRPGGGSR